MNNPKNYTPLNLKPELPIVLPEDLEIAKTDHAEAIKYRLTPKYKEWTRLFLDKTNKETFGNATKSAIKAYDLHGDTGYASGSQIGYENLRKLENIGRKYYERQGITYGKMMDVLFNKMLKSDKIELWFMIMEILGLKTPDFKPVTSPTFIQQNIQNNVEQNITSYSNLTDEQLDQLIRSKASKARLPETIGGKGETDVLEPIEVHTDTPETIRGNDQ